MNINAKVEQMFFTEINRRTLKLDTDELQAWYDSAVKSLSYQSPVTLKCSQKQFLELLNHDDRKVTLYQIAMLCNSIEESKPADFNYDEYVAMIKTNIYIQDTWKSITDVIREGITEMLSQKTLFQSEESSLNDNRVINEQQKIKI